MVVRDGPGEQQRAGVVPVAVGLDHFGAGGGDELAGVDLDAVPGLRLEADVGLFEVFERFGSAVAGVDRVERLAEADIQVKADWARGAIDGDLAHVDVQRVGAEIEVPELVVSGIGMIEVRVDVAVEQETEIGSEVREGRRRGRGRGRRRRGRGRRLGRCLIGRLLSENRARKQGRSGEKYA